jgi:hypothetical protein
MLITLKKEGDMLRRPRFIIGLILLVIVSFALGGCGSGKKEGSVQTTTIDLANAVKLGNANCLQCHNAGKDLTMINDLDTRTIGAVYEDSVHFNPLFSPNADGFVQCEDCHGGGEFHWGTGPLAHPVPDWHVCIECHDGTHGGPNFPVTFPETVHANTDMRPDKFFFQGSVGTTQATDHGVPEVTPDGQPVTKNQHIEECSACHDSNQRFVYDDSGNLILPDPNNMPDPTVSCANCHDAHQVGKITMVPQRAGNVVYPIFRKEQIPQNGKIVRTGPWVRPVIYQPNGAVQPDGTVDPSRVMGTNNQLSVELICAACHTKGLYKYSQKPTHQENVYPQWLNSGHGTRNDPAFAEFSANPPAYTNPDTGETYSLGSHYTSYPFDMALNATGATANTTQNAGNNNFACFHCHNGIGTLSWMEDIQGTPDADVVFGDEPVMCLTCHSPHSQPTGTKFMLRVPVKMTQYSGAVNIDGNFFLDGTPIPPIKDTDNSTICIFCHQGRESGLTLYAEKLAPGADITGSFFNPHYLGTAAMLWGVNAYEYPGKFYSVNAAHQEKNCAGCHMDNPTDDNLNGGHTWWPNVATCNVESCHGGFGPVAADPTSENGPASPDVDNYRASFDTHNYTGETGGETLSIAVSIQHLEKKVIDLLASKGIEYDDLSYPYFFQAGKEHVRANAFQAWTPAEYKAAFNLSYIIKGLPSGAESQVDVPNASGAVHNYKYIIQLLLDSYQDLNGAPVPNAERPVGTRPARDYPALMSQFQ